MYLYTIKYDFKAINTNIKYINDLIAKFIHESDKSLEKQEEYEEALIKFKEK